MSKSRPLRFESLEPRAMLTAAATGAFSAANTIATFVGATSVQTADIDKDGDLDVLATSTDGNGAKWFENKRGGAWVAHTITTTALQAQDISTADIDGDGDLDVLVASEGDDTIAWYENIGTPPGSAWTFHSVSTNANGAVKVTAADLDNDGDMDILSASFDDDKICWYINDGTPKTGVWPTRSISELADGATSVVTADMDGDGDLDVLSSSFNNDTIQWYENDGTPAVGGWVARTIANTADGAAKVYAADIDGDGDMDVVSVSQNDGRILWCENDGTPKDGGWVGHLVGTAGAPQSASIVDIDGDGDLDICVVAHNDNRIVWFANDGTPGTGLWAVVPFATGGAAQNAVGVSTGDMDGDGDVDVISASISPGTIAWYRNPAGQVKGDYDRDGHVGMGDFNLWKASVGSVYGAGMAADGNGDGMVDLADFTLIQDNWGSTPPPVGGSGGTAGGVDSSIVSLIAEQPTIAPVTVPDGQQLQAAANPVIESAPVSSVSRAKVSVRAFDQVFLGWESQGQGDLRNLRVHQAPARVSRWDSAVGAALDARGDANCKTTDSAIGGLGHALVDSNATSTLLRSRY